METRLPHEPARAQGLRAVRGLFRATAWSIAVHAGIGCLALVLAAWVYTRNLGDGPWAMLGSWTLGAAYALAGFGGGAAAGLVAAVIALITAFERECRTWLERQASPDDDASFPPFSPQDLSTRTRDLADRIVARTLGRIPLPDLVVRLVSAQVCKVLFDDFLTDCRQRGLATIRFADMRAWLLSRGLALSTAPLLAKLFLVRWLIIGALAALGAAAGLMALVG